MADQCARVLLTTTIKLRLRDKHARELSRQARAVNFVWNYCNETQQKVVRYGRRWLSAYDLQLLTSGSSKELNIHSHTIKEICRYYEKARIQSRKPWLRFRRYSKSLGWVPFGKSHVTVVSPGVVVFRGVRYHTKHWRHIPTNSTILSGSFNQDSRGRWYVNLPVEVQLSTQSSTISPAVGIDLGIKTTAVLSTGERVINPRFFFAIQDRLIKAHVANKRRQVKAISARAANSRRDHLHKASAAIAARHQLIFVGDVSATKLAMTNLSKSVLDVGWSTFRKQLSYKAMRHGGRCIEVDENSTTQTCSTCGQKPEGRPKGIAGLGIREWTCGDCGASHDRDVNAARNILRRGLATLAEGNLK